MSTRHPHLGPTIPSRRGDALAWWLAAAVAACVPTMARAQEPGGDGARGDRAGQGDGGASDVDEAARLLFQRGVEAYRGGRYEEALQRFEQAYELTGDAELLFNVGTTLDRLRRDRDAVAAFRQYLRERPDAPNRVAVQRRIDALEENLGPPPDAATPAASPEETARDAEAESDVEPDDGRRGLHPALFWSGVGVTASLGGVLVWSGLDTVDKNDAYESAADQVEARPLRDDALSAQRRTNGLIAATAVVGAATVVLAFFTDFGGDDDRDQEDAAAGHGVDDGETAARPAHVSPPVPFAGIDAHGAVFGVTGRF